MIKQLLLFFIFFTINIETVHAQSNSYDSILTGPDWRTFRVHLPKGYTTAQTYSLVLGLHGGGGSALQFALSSELIGKSDSAGFIVVFPEGKKNPGAIGARTWNAGYCCANNSTVGTNDVGFISQLIDTLLSRYSIDTNRVYAAGHSNGGMMCYRLATELSGKIAAVAISGATMVRNYPFSPSRPVPVIHFHSYKDLNVPFYGGQITNVVPPVYSPPVDSIVSIWADFDQCSIKQDTVHKDAKYNAIVFRKGKCNSEVNLYITHDGGHAWPGGKPGGGPDSDTPSTAIHANYLLWKFFQQHSLHCPTTGQEELNTNNHLVIFPNPLSTAHPFLQLHLPQDAYVITIYDGAMREIKKLQNFKNEMQVDCSGMAPGLYLIEAVGGKNRYKTKFLIR